MSNQGLPTSLVQNLGNTPELDKDKIVSLTAEVQFLKDALAAKEKNYTELESKTRVLRNNEKIKEMAVKYARYSLFIIPITSLALLLLSANKGFATLLLSANTGFAMTNVKLVWQMELNPYAQAALIVSPVVFIATILGLLLKGVFSQNIEDFNVGAKSLLSEIKPEN